MYIDLIMSYVFHRCRIESTGVKAPRAILSQQSMIRFSFNFGWFPCQLGYVKCISGLMCGILIENQFSFTQNIPVSKVMEESAV